MERILALVIAWNLASLLRVLAVFLLDRHSALGLNNLAISGCFDAFFGLPYLPRALGAAAAAFLLGELIARFSMRDSPRAGQRLACIVTLLAFWIFVAIGEVLDRSNVVGMMSNEISLSRRHFVVLAGATGAAAVTFGVWSALMRTGRRAAPAVALLTVVISLCAATPKLVLGTSAVSADAPNVVLITIDTLRADHVSAYGYGRDTTPTLDVLSDSGTLFLNAVSQAPNTHPSMAAMITSSYPTNLGGRLKYIPPGVGTLAEAFANAGYETSAIVSNVWLKDKMGFDSGFAHFDQTSAMSEFYADRERIDWKRADLVSDAAIEWLQANSEEPFFLWIHYLDPHHPYNPHESVRDRFVTAPAATRSYLDSVGRMPTKEQTQWLAKAYGGEIPDTSDTTFQAIRDLYDAEIFFTDMQIGRVLKELDEPNGRDTVIAVTADHGEEFRDHAGWGHSHTLHYELLDVPLIIADSRTTGGIKREDRVRVIDLAPTLLDRAGISAPPSMLGASLDQNTGDRIAIGVLTQRDMFSIESEGWKLISREFGKTFELYDIREDPYETIDVSEAHPDVVSELRDLLAKELGHGARAESMSATADRLDSGTRKQLEALGYID